MKSNAPGHFQRRLEQRNPYLFVEYWKEGERPFNWFAEWEHLSVEISDIRVAIRHQYLTRNSLSDAQSIPLAKINEDAVPENIPNDQKKAYLEFVFRLFNEAFTKPDSQETLMISGMFATENDSIGFIRSGETEGKRTQKGYISLYGSADIRRGSLWTVNEEEFKFDPSRKPGEVCIDLYLASAQMKSAIAEIKQAAIANRQIKVMANFYVLAFQSEVERSLSEPYHSQTYWFRDGALSPAVLERLTIWPVSSQATKSAPDDDNKDDAPQPTIPLTPPTIGSVSAAAPPRHSVKALVIALWAIAVAIVFHALLNLR